MRRCTRRGQLFGKSEPAEREPTAGLPEPQPEPEPQVDRAEGQPEPQPLDRGGLWMDPDEAERIDRWYEGLR